MELKVLFAAARRGLVVIVLSALLGAAAAVLVQRSMPEEYAASATLLLDPIAVVVPGRQPSSGDPERYIESQLRLLASARIADRAAQSLLEQDGDDVQQAISLTQITGSDVVDVTARASSPRAASDMANALVTAYVELREEEAEAARQAQVAAVQQRIEEVEAQLVPPAPGQVDVSFDQQLLRDQIAGLQVQLDSLVVSNAVVDRTIVLDPATTPTAPERIALPLVVAAGAMAGALIGFAFAAVREFLAPRVISASHTELLLGRPVIAEFTARRRLRPSGHDAAGSAGRTTGGMAEAATALASTVASTPSRAPRRQVCVSSAARADGVLEVASALAAALASQGAVVALVTLSDDGTHRPSSPAPVPSDDGSAPDVPRWTAEPTAGSRLTVWHPRTTSEALRIEDVQQLCTRLPEGCDVVVLHAPPVLRSPLTAQISRESDDLLMVVQVGEELEADLTRATHTLRSAGTEAHPVTYRAGRRSRRG